MGGRGGDSAPGGHHGGGPGRGSNHRQRQGPGGGRQGVSFDDAAEYDYIDDARTLFGDEPYPPLRCAFSDAEYEARQQSIFHPNGASPMNNDARGSMPPPAPANEWYRQQGMDLHPTMNLPGHLSQQGRDPAWYGQQGVGNYPSVTPPGPHGEQGQELSPGLCGEEQMPTATPLGQQGQPPAPGPPGRVQNSTNATAVPQAPTAQQGGVHIAVQPPGGTNVGGMPQNLTGRAAHGTSSQDYSGISRALEHLALIMTDADTSLSSGNQYLKIFSRIFSCFWNRMHSR